MKTYFGIKMREGLVRNQEPINVEDEEAYHTSGALSFGDALLALEKGKKVSRIGWNSKGMFLILVQGTKDIVPYKDTPYSKVTGHIGKESISILPRIDMYTAQGDMVCGWLASQTDMLAKDWVVI